MQNCLALCARSSDESDLNCYKPVQTAGDGAFSMGTGMSQSPWALSPAGASMGHPAPWDTVPQWAGQATPGCVTSPVPSHRQRGQGFPSCDFPMATGRACTDPIWI